MKTAYTIIILFFSSGLFAQNTDSDIGRNIVYLITTKDGKAYRGRPVMEEQGNWVRIKTKTGKRVMIAYDDIETLEKQEASITDYNFNYGVAWGGGQFLSNTQSSWLLAIPITVNYDFTDQWTLGFGYELYLGGDVAVLPGVGAPVFDYNEMAFFLRPGYMHNKGKPLAHYFSLGVGLGRLDYQNETTANRSTLRMLVSPKYELGIRLGNRAALAPYVQYNIPIGDPIQPMGTWSAGIGVKMYGTSFQYW
jgi:hypothetical protein